MHSDAATGKRLSRNGGSEYSAPTASPAATATVSTAPCVTRQRERDRRAGDARSPRAAPSESSPAAIGRNGLLIRSISTSVIWLTPTIAMLTVRPATSVAEQVAHAGGAVALGGGDQRRARRPRAPCPMIVCGREKRHRHAAAGLARACVAATAHARAPRGERGRAASARPRSGRTAAPAAEPATKRDGEAQRGPTRLLGAPARGGAGDGPGRGLDAADRQRVRRAPVAVPVRRQLAHPHVGEARRPPSSPCTPRRPGRASTSRPAPRATRLAGRTGPITSARAAGARHAVGLGDAALRVRPVLDRARGDVAVERVVGERQVLGVPEHPRAVRERRLGAASAPAGAGDWSSIVTLGGVHARHDPLGREARPGARVEHRQPALQTAPPPAPARASRASRTAG